MSATPAEVAAGGTAQLTWQSHNADSVTIDNGIGRVALSGTMNVSPAQNVTYTATATNAKGSVSMSATITVGGAVSVAISPSAQAVAAGQTATLTWQSANATAVTISGIGAVATNGSITVAPAQTTTYTATATGNGGVSAEAATTVAVFSQTPAITSSADKTTITAGDLVTLSWTSTNAQSASVSPDIEIEGADTFPLSGSTTVSPTTTTTYVFTASNPMGTQQGSVTITVNQLPPSIALTPDRSSILAGESATLSWTSEHADSITIDNGIGSVTAPSGSQPVTPANTTTYTATATGSGGTKTMSATVTVTPPSGLGVSLAADQTTIPAGQSATLTWSSQNATSVTVDGCSACAGLTGSAQVSPSDTTTYMAHATDASGNVTTASTTINVVAPGGFQDKIKHIFIYMQENRSFDHYFGRLGDYRARTQGLPATDIDGQDLNLILTDKNGARYKAFHQPTVCVDIASPGWNESHFFAHRKSGGPWAMDQWLKQATDSQAGYTGGRDPRYTRSIGYFNEKELPYYYELATQFATSDRQFASVMGPTVPNRMYLFTGTSFGHIRPDDDLKAQNPDKRWNQLTFFEWMTQKNPALKWKYYYQNGSVYLADYNVWTRGSDPSSTDTAAKTTVGRVRNISELYTFLADPNADTLVPSIVFIEQDPPDFFNEHPSNPYGMQPGANNTKKILDALMKSAAWKSSVFILLFDEAGGFYDHVAPASVPDPDGIAPIFKTGDLTKGPAPESLPYNFTQSGLRVPFVVISPWVKKNFVSHTPREHTSILAFIESRFSLPPLPSGRDRFYSTDDMMEFFDFNNPSWLTPPPLPDQPWKNAAMVNAGKAPAPADPNAGTCNRNLEVAPTVP